jgi:hypothetical protein
MRGRNVVVPVISFAGVVPDQRPVPMSVPVSVLAVLAVGVLVVGGRRLLVVLGGHRALRKGC